MHGRDNDDKKNLIFFRGGDKNAPSYMSFLLSCLS